MIWRKMKRQSVGDMDFLIEAKLMPLICFIEMDLPIDMSILLSMLKRRGLAKICSIPK